MATKAIPKETVAETTANLQTILESMSTDTEEEYTPSTPIELTHEIVEAMFDEQKLKMITDLTELEIKGMLKLHTLNAIIFEGRSSVLTMLADEIMMLKISKNRKGRAEMIQAIHSNDPEQNTVQSRFGRFLGR